MKFFPRSLLGSVLTPKKGKDKQAGKDTAAPSVPESRKGVPSPSVPAVGSAIPTPSVTDLDKDLPTPSTAGAAKDTPAPSAAHADSASDGNARPPTVTTSITVSITDTRTVTSAATTITIVQHDLATVATTEPTTVTIVPHGPATAATTAPTTILTTTLATPCTKPIAAAAADATVALLPAGSAMPVSKKHVEPAAVVAVVFGLIALGLLCVIGCLVLEVRRLAKTKPTAGTKTYAEEFDWPRAGAVEMDDIERKDEWGPKQKEAWGVA